VKEVLAMSAPVGPTDSPHIVKAWLEATDLDQFNGNPWDAQQAFTEAHPEAKYTGADELITEAVQTAHRAKNPMPDWDAPEFQVPVTPLPFKLGSAAKRRAEESMPHTTDKPVQKTMTDAEFKAWSDQVDQEAVNNLNRAALAENDGLPPLKPEKTAQK
jgi:hypothetical protein